jgi:PPOX class probable F420-dependent enzyme
MLSEKEERFVLSQRVGHLATADAAGSPHVVPVCYAYELGRFWIAVDEKPKRNMRLKRLKNIEANPRVSLVVDRYDDDWSRLGYVLVRGSAALIERGPEHKRALAALRQRYGRYRGMRLEDRPVICITPERVISWGDLD